MNAVKNGRNAKNARSRVTSNSMLCTVVTAFGTGWTACYNGIGMVVDVMNIARDGWRWWWNDAKVGNIVELASFPAAVGYFDVSGRKSLALPVTAIACLASTAGCEATA